MGLQEQQQSMSYTKTETMEALVIPGEGARSNNDIS